MGHLYNSEVEMSSRTVRLVIAGSRGFDDYSLLCSVCDNKLNKLIKDHDIIIISGGANGADKLGERYANERGFKLIVMKADWDKHGKSAGYIRNSEMADEATHVITFWDSVSRGTRHMIDIANKAGLKLCIVKY